MPKFQLIQTKFKPSIIRELLDILSSIDCSSGTSTEKICEELQTATQELLDNKYVWMVGTDMSYFVQYQIDCYAIFKGAGKVVLVWKPKYLEYPTLIKLTDFGQTPKILKSVEVATEEVKGSISEQVQSKLATYIKMFYSFYFHALAEPKFESDLLTQLKHYTSRISKQSYWHCGIDAHNKIETTAKTTYIRLRVSGIKDKYDKDIIIFSQKGVREYFSMLGKGKFMQLISFVAMLLIFIAVVNCGKDNREGVCYYRDQMIFGAAAIMMGLMGMKFVGRNKMKKRLDKKLEQLDKAQ